MKKGFTPLEKVAAQTVRERSSLTGFTLLETLVVVAILSFVFAALIMVLSSGRTSWSQADSQIALQQDLRQAITEMVKDLGQSGQSQVSRPANSVAYASISFNQSQGALSSGAINWSTSPITFSLSGNQVLETQGADSRVLANNVTSLTFTRQVAAPRVIRINMTTSRETMFGRAVNASLASSVFLRN
jgi:prepilin-type N-terminal cleavage/methylation domain-containing protein